MNVLLVEDDENKRQQLLAAVSRVPGLELDVAHSVKAGKRRLLDHTYDLLIVDMTLPTFDVGPTERGGRIQSYGGRELLRYATRRNRNTPAIVVTAFDKFGEGKDALDLADLERQLAAEFPSYLGTVQYNVAEERWNRELLNMIHIAKRGARE